MRHRELSIAAVLIVGLAVVAPSGLASAQVITDLTYDLGSLTEPELLVDWNAFGLGTRTGIRVTTAAAGDTRTYTHTGLGLDNGEAFLMDAVFSGQDPGADVELGARMWVRFHDAALPPMQYRHVEARFVRVAGTYQVQLFGGTGAVSPLGGLPQDWRGVTPRLRVRIRYQEVAGAPTIFLVAENSALWEPDLSGPLTPGVTNSLSVPMNGTNFPGSAGSTEFGFGNVVPGSYSSDFETVRLIRSSESDTVLPAAFAFDIPTLGAPGIAVLVILLAVGGWLLLVRLRT